MTSLPTFMVINDNGCSDALSLNLTLMNADMKVWNGLGTVIPCGRKPIICRAIMSSSNVATDPTIRYAIARQQREHGLGAGH